MTTDEPQTNPPDAAEARLRLESILASNAFHHAPRAQQFLRFVVEETLAGRAGEITEPVVAAQVFDLSSRFDRRNNSIVRAEATHVRRRLRHYYLSDGISDPVIIDMPRGGYAPVFRAAAGSKPSEAGRRQLDAFLALFRPARSTPPE
jgi:hypothetical protein